MGLPSSVSSLVFGELDLPHECFLTFLASMGFLSSFISLMSNELCFMREGFPTLAKFVCISYVSFVMVTEL
jgi:hypothetical protein